MLLQEEAVIQGKFLDRQGKETVLFLKTKASVESRVRAGGSEWSATCNMTLPCLY